MCWIQIWKWVFTYVTWKQNCCQKSQPSLLHCCLQRVISERVLITSFCLSCENLWHEIQKACKSVTFLKNERAVSERDLKCVVHPVKLVSATSITLKAFCWHEVCKIWRNFPWTEIGEMSNNFCRIKNGGAAGEMI